MDGRTEVFIDALAESWVAHLRSGWLVTRRYGQGEAMRPGREGAAPVADAHAASGRAGECAHQDHRDHGLRSGVQRCTIVWSDTLV